MATPYVSLQDVSKRFGPVQALEDVALELHAGEVHCLAGENGAGKSTLIKILTGAVQRDRAPTRSRAGRSATRRPAEARAAGIGVVYQELSLLPDLSVGGEPADGPAAGPPRHHPARRAAQAGAGRCSSGSASTTSTRTRRSARLSLAVRQLVEIAKVLGQNPRVLIFDEPTTALSESETRALLGAHQAAARRGPRDHVRQPPPGGDVRDRRPGHGAARRQVRRDRRRCASSTTTA